MAGTRSKKVSGVDESKTKERKKMSTTITIKGPITDKTSFRVFKRCLDIRENQKIKHVKVRISSKGGSVESAYEIYEWLSATNKRISTYSL